MNNVTRLLVPLAFLVGFVFLLSLVPTSLESHAQRIITKCGRATHLPTCYDQEIPKLMDQGWSMEEAFAVTRIIQEQTDGYFYCHVLSHTLAGREVAKDPSQWLEVVARCPTDICSNGCLHGAAQERFRADSLTPEQVADVTPELMTLCEADNGLDFTEFRRASCYHALGHLSMYLAGGDVATAAALCRDVAGRPGIEYHVTCYEGLYMQIFQPLEPEDIALVQHIPVATKEDARNYCDSFDTEQRAACHRESRPLYGTLATASKLEAFCSLVPGERYTRDCYAAILYTLVPYFEYDIERIDTLCARVPKEWIGQCYANAAGRFVQSDARLIDGAVAVCRAAETHGAGDRCYYELLYYSGFLFHDGSAGFTALCSALPEPWLERCLQGEGKDLELFHPPVSYE